MTTSSNYDASWRFNLVGLNDATHLLNKNLELEELPTTWFGLVWLSLMLIFTDRYEPAAISASIERLVQKEIKQLDSSDLERIGTDLDKVQSSFAIYAWSGQAAKGISALTRLQGKIVHYQASKAYEENLSTGRSDTFTSAVENPREEAQEPETRLYLTQVKDDYIVNRGNIQDLKQLSMKEANKTALLLKIHNEKKVKDLTRTGIISLRDLAKELFKGLDYSQTDYAISLLEKGLINISNDTVEKLSKEKGVYNTIKANDKPAAKPTREMAVLTSVQTNQPQSDKKDVGVKIRTTIENLSSKISKLFT